MDSIWALGLMSGTSLDGIDAALIKTDGESIAEIGAWLSEEYDAEFRAKLAAATKQQGDLKAVERELTLRHAKAVHRLIEASGMTPDVIGFHGQTIDHRPEEGTTWQLGDGALLAAETGINVVNDFRSADMKAGGQGAPLVPLYHAALAHDMAQPLAVVNIGGIANITYINGEEMLAFDVGTGNGLMNQLVEARSGAAYDKDGALALAGHADEAVVSDYLAQDYFQKTPPKSLDRHDFNTDAVAHLSLEDAVRTLLEVTAQGIAQSAAFLPQRPKQWLICGGGAQNPVLMSRLTELLSGVRAVDAVGWHGDALEAQAFGFLAVRSVRNLPLTLPPLTGARHPALGGVFYPA